VLCGEWYVIYNEAHCERFHGTIKAPNEVPALSSARIFEVRTLANMPPTAGDQLETSFMDQVRFVVEFVCVELTPRASTLAG